MPENTTHSTKINPPGNQNYGLGFLLGILSGLAVYFFYGTAKGQRLRRVVKLNQSVETDPDSFQVTLTHFRQKIANFRHTLEPLLEKNPVSKTPPKSSPKSTRHYFKAKK